MTKVSFAARAGAAAFVAGLSLAVPQWTAIATAERTDSPSSSDSSSASTSRGAGQSARGAAPRARGGAQAAASTPRAAATRSAPETRRTAVGGRTHPAADNAPAAQPSATARAVADQPTGAAVAPAPEVSAPTGAAPAPPTAVATTVADTTAPSPAGTAARVVAPAGSSALAEITAVTAPARPGALAAVTASAGAAADASSAALIDRLLAPISRLFGEGTALLVRRSFFNQAPTTAPVQLTGQSEGPITGTIGAIDPEGDPLSYKITSAPLRGSVVVNADGTYTYTPGTGFAGADNFVVAVTDTGFHINLLDLRRPDSTSADVGVTQGTIAALLQFRFSYGSGSQYWSSAARDALESAATRLSSYIVVTSPVTVTFEVTGEKSLLSSTLASAGSDFVDDGSGFLQTVVQNKILTGADANGSAADGTIDWNFGPSWAFGDSVSNSQYDFQAIAMHEMLHALGFLSNIDRAGSNTGQVWTVFDGFVTDNTGSPVINGTTYNWNTDYNPNLTGGNGGLYFAGPNAVSVYQARVPLYTPSPWSSGSSLSHINGNYLMRAIINMGPKSRVVSAVELAMLRDIGYTVTSGPGAPVLLFVGFVTLRVRRRKD